MILRHFFSQYLSVEKVINFFKLFSIFFIINFITRIILTIINFSNLDSPIEIVLSFFIGFIFDFITLSCIISVFSFIFIFIPKKITSSKVGVLIFTIAFIISNIAFIFNAVAEYFFWEEFSSRFNFLAIDYLIYTQELITNCIQSYPVYRILLGILIISIAIVFTTIKKFSFFKYIKSLLMVYPDSIKRKFKLVLPFILLTIFNKFFINHSQISSFFSKNTLQAEISKNGIHELFSAYFSNTLDYNRFYKTIDKKLAKKNIQTALGGKFTDSEIERKVISKSTEDRKNVIFILSESMGSEYIFTWKDRIKKKDTITPSLRKMIEEGIFFENFYADGTRTVRGIEATTLSIPPTPGPSIVRRRHLPDLYNIGSVFKDRGYDLRFVYGGNGYFDNMGEYFASAGFKILDSKTYTKDENKFANAWGHCDEDGYKKVLKQGDESFRKKKKFFTYFLTTSNHRPYTYPDNTISFDPRDRYDRLHAVKYADYALGEFLKEIKKKPWYKNTIIVYVADHCAGSGGRFDINLQSYKIPFVLYGKDIKPKIVKKVCGQTDILPTLMGILNFNYSNKFFGEDILSSKFKEKAFVSTFQNLGYVENDKMVVLSPRSNIQCFSVKRDLKHPIRIIQKQISPERCDNIIEKAVSYYQYSSELFNNGYYFNKN